MYKHHEESIIKVAEYFKQEAEVEALLLGGSIAHGFELPSSDIDVMILVSYQSYAERLSQGRVHFFNMELCTYHLGGGDPRMGQKAEGIVGWWAVCGSRYTGEGVDFELPVRWKPLACTPICWMPRPPREHEKKLRRRMGQLMRNKV